MGKALKAITGIFQPMKLPKEATQVPTMPDPGSAAAKLDAVKKVRQRAKSGREGTIYSGAYGGQNLAGTA